MLLLKKLVSELFIKLVRKLMLHLCWIQIVWLLHLKFSIYSSGQKNILAKISLSVKILKLNFVVKLRIKNYIISLQIYHFRIAACGGELSGEGIIRSPFYPDAYPGERICRWTIFQPQGQVVLLNFTAFELGSSANCETDYVEVRLK